MSSPQRETIKRREIAFSELHPDKNQAETALLVLTEIPGIQDLRVLSPLRLGISYDILLISFQEIEELLEEVGFHLAGDLIYRIKRALLNYTEEIQRTNLGEDHRKPGSTHKVFIERYHRLNHECRDKRPDIWRHYR